MTEATTMHTTQNPTLKQILGHVGIQNLSLLLALAVLLSVFGYLRDDVFFSACNLTNIGMGVTILGVLAISQILVIVYGWLGISVGSIVGLTTVATAMAIEATGAAGVGLVAGVVVGAMA